MFDFELLVVECDDARARCVRGVLCCSVVLSCVLWCGVLLCCLCCVNSVAWLLLCACLLCMFVVDVCCAG